jgi:hypothetical protein
VISVACIQSDHTWIVLEGSIEGIPQVTHRRSIHAAALASGALILSTEKAELIAEVERAYIRWQAVQRALAEL